MARQTYGKVSFLGKISLTDKKAPSKVVYNVYDLSNGEIDGGNNYEFTMANKTCSLFSVADARFFIENKKQFNVDVTGVKLKSKQVKTDEIVEDDGTPEKK